MSEEDPELRDLVAKCLENNGVLGKLRVFCTNFSSCIKNNNLFIYFRLSYVLVHFWPWISKMTPRYKILKVCNQLIKMLPFSGYFSS